MLYKIEVNVALSKEIVVEAEDMKEAREMACEMADALYPTSHTLWVEEAGQLNEVGNGYVYVQLYKDETHV